MPELLSGDRSWIMWIPPSPGALSEGVIMLEKPSIHGNQIKVCFIVLLSLLTRMVKKIINGLCERLYSCVASTNYYYTSTSRAFKALGLGLILTVHTVQL